MWAERSEGSFRSLETADLYVAFWFIYSCLRFDRPFPIGYGPNLLFIF